MRELGIERHVDNIFKNPKSIKKARMFFCYERVGIISVSVSCLCMMLLNKRLNVL